MTIEEDFETLRYSMSPMVRGEAADRIKAERDALKAEVVKWKSKSLALRQERDALKMTVDRLTGMLPTSDYNEIREERDALKAALEEIAYRLHGNFEKETPEEQAIRVARRALAKLEEK